MTCSHVRIFETIASVLNRMDGFEHGDQDPDEQGMPDPMELHQDNGQAEGMDILDRYDRVLFRVNAAIERCPKFADVAELMEGILRPVYDRWMRRIRSPNDVLPVVLSEIQLYSNQDDSFRDVVPGGDRTKACVAILEEIDDAHRDVWCRLRPMVAPLMVHPTVLAEDRGRAREVETLAQDLVRTMIAARCILQAHADIVTCTSNHAPLYADRTVTAYGAYSCMPLAPFSPDDEGMRDDRARLTTFLLSKMRALGLRKKQGTTALFKGVYTEDGQPTYTFAPYKFSMEQFVYRHCRRDDAYNMWTATIRASIVTDVVKHLERCVDRDLPVMEPDNSLYALEDGMYCVETDQFIRWEDNVEEVFGDRLHHGAYKYLKGHRMAPHYYANDEQDDDDFMDDGGSDRWSFPEEQDLPVVYEVPAVDQTTGLPRKRLDQLKLGAPIMKIFRDQGFSSTTVFLLLACLGRLFFNAGRHDQSQFWPVFLGQAGTGKTTLLDVFTNFFHPQDVGAVSPDSEERFGRDRLLNSRFILVPDLRGERMGLSMAFFLSVVSRDPVVIPVKFGAPIQVDSFPLQGIIASNELPQSWLNDHRGAVSRRLCIFPFTVVPTPKNPNLKNEIVEGEYFAALLRAVALAYRMLPKDIDIASDYPMTDEMVRAKASMLRATNPVFHMVDSEYVSVGEGLSCRLRDLEMAFKEFIKSQRPGERAPQWTPELYSHALRLKGCRVVDDDGVATVMGLAINDL